MSDSESEIIAITEAGVATHTDCECSVNIKIGTRHFVVKSSLLRKSVTLVQANNRCLQFQTDVPNAGPVQLVFAHRDPELFASVLHFLQTGTLSIPHKRSYREVQNECDYFCVRPVPTDKKLAKWTHVSTLCILYGERQKKSRCQEQKEAEAVVVHPQDSEGEAISSQDTEVVTKSEDSETTEVENDNLEYTYALSAFGTSTLLWCKEGWTEELQDFSDVENAAEACLLLVEFLKTNGWRVAKFVLHKEMDTDDLDPYFQVRLER